MSFFCNLLLINTKLHLKFVIIAKYTYFMKRILAGITFACFIMLLFTTQASLSSCTKEKIIHDTTIIVKNDTTVIIQRDTIKLILAPCDNPDEGNVNSYYPTSNGSGGEQLTVSAWTHNGSPENARIYLNFDYSQLPVNPIIISAKLSLYATTTPGAGNYIDAQFGTANAAYIQRITSTWPIAALNWNSQPTTTTENQVTIPQSTSSFEDNIDMDVTTLFRDMLSNGNYGFAIKLQSETIYNIRQYVSSFSTNHDKHPVLIIDYKKQ